MSYEKTIRELFANNPEVFTGEVLQQIKPLELNFYSRPNGINEFYIYRAGIPIVVEDGLSPLRWRRQCQEVTEAEISWYVGEAKRYAKLIRGIDIEV